MASYITTETDMSRVTALSTDTKNFVFVPINSTWGPDDEYVELTSTTQLQNVYGGDPEVGEDGLEELTSYQYAAGVLRNGFSVLAKRVVDNTINKKAYAEDADTDGRRFKVAIGNKSSDIIIQCKQSTSEHAITAKYYGGHANNFIVMCTTKFMDSSHVGLYFIVKRNNVTLEENLFGKLHYEEVTITTEQSTRVVYYLVFEPSNPVSEYIDFGSYDYVHGEIDGDRDDDPQGPLVITTTIDGESTSSDTSCVLPFAETEDTMGANITRAQAKTAVTSGFTPMSTTSTGEFITNVGDKWLYDVKFISNGGYVDESTFESETPTINKAIAEGMIAIAEKRQDCVAFIDASKGCTNTTNVEKYVTSLNEKSAYAAVYSPWCKATPYGTNSTVWVPASYLAITSFAKSFASGNSICDVPAGVNRGSINIIKPQFIIGGVTQERWQRGNGEGSDLTFCINPIMNIRKYGYCIFGQRTLLELPYGSTSALQELCVRLTLNEIKRWVRDVALSLTFESNSNRTWNEFVSKTQQCLDKLVAGGYLTNYKIIRSTDNTNQVNTNSLNATIQAYVTRALENFNINVEVFSGEVTFTETTE